VVCSGKKRHLRLACQVGNSPRAQAYSLQALGRLADLWHWQATCRHTTAGLILLGWAWDIGGIRCRSVARGLRPLGSGPRVLDPLWFSGGVYGYTWLLQHTAPTLVATHSFVNPVVAVLLGWLLAGEALTLRLVMATIATLGAIVLIQEGDRQNGRRADAARSDYDKQRTGTAGTGS
jgi:hypothetical protein